MAPVPEYIIGHKIFKLIGENRFQEETKYQVR
jgi:hypothetical protein